jgi:hypothetical protein
MTPSREADPRADSQADEVAVLFALVRQRYGDRLDAAQLERVREGIASLVAQVQALRAVRLRNADEPWPPFVPLRGAP